MSETAIITGGSGFIGTHLSRELLRRGGLVIVLDLKPPVFSDAKMEYRLCDVSDILALRKFWESANRVFHLAAQVSVPMCQKDPRGSTLVNFMGTQNVCEVLLEKTPKAKFVFPSSSAVYGHSGKKLMAISEQDSVAPLSYYAFQKLWSEQMMSLYGTERGLSAVALRLFNVFGPGQDPTSPYSGVISQFMFRLKAGQDLKLFNQGENTRDFVHVDDVVAAFISAADLPKATELPIFNIGSGRATTVLELAMQMREIAGQKVSFEKVGPRSGDVEHSLASIAKAKKELAYSPRRSLGEGLAELFR